MTRRDVMVYALCAGLYVLLTALLSWDVLGALGTRMIHDEVDPLLIAAILQWNASHVPLTHAWWQFPIFHPAADTLAFSEHLLGVSLIAAPIAWVSGNPILAANLTTLATFPLCALAAFALAKHLTGSSPAAFVAGLIYAFGPYRMSQLAHLQMLSVQWIPLAVLALHLYVKTARRRWLALLGAAWLVQALSNGYTLFILSVFVGLWTLWFVVLARRWRALLPLVVTILAATAPLVPILWTYLTVHARNGFSRGPGEVVAFSADAMGVLCAPFEVSAWGWLKYACRAEGELFPGLVTALLAVGALFVLRPEPGAVARWQTTIRWVQGLALAGGASELVAGLCVGISGPWELRLGPVVARASAPARPITVAFVALLVAVALSRRIRAAVARATPLGFYVAAIVMMWWCALGPWPLIFGEAGRVPGPFALLMRLPGFSSLRVPGRFWLMATLCLAVVAAMVVAELCRRMGRVRRMALVVGLSLGVLSDGWELHVPSGAVAPGPPNAVALEGQQVLYLPAGSYGDVVPTYYSVVQGWRSVNGYSGFEPTHYDGVRQSAKFELDGVFVHYRSIADLHVVVAAGAPRLRVLVERQPGAILTARTGYAAQYRLPRLEVSRAGPVGQPLTVRDVTSSCPPANVLVDGRVDGLWTCTPQIGRETITIELATPAAVAGILMTLGRPVEFPRQLLVETSADGESWTAARSGDVVPEFIDAALASPTQPSLRVALTPPVAARFVRLRQVGQDPASSWSLREVEVLGPGAEGR